MATRIAGITLRNGFNCLAGNQISEEKKRKFAVNLTRGTELIRKMAADKRICSNFWAQWRRARAVEIRVDFQYQFQLESSTGKVSIKH